MYIFKKYEETTLIGNNSSGQTAFSSLNKPVWYHLVRVKNNMCQYTSAILSGHA